MFIDINGIKINTVSFGSGEETFLGISGFVADWRVWSFVIEDLSKRMRCVAFDHRGCGESTAPLKTISKQSYVDDLFGVMDRLGIEKCYLGGESFGGAIALLAALKNPERFKGLILIDTNLPNAKPIDENRRKFINFLRSDHKAAIQAFIESVMPEPDIEHIKRMGVHICLRTDVESTVKILQIVAEGENEYPLHEIKTPTLIIYGDKDSESIIQNSHYLEEILPYSELVSIKGAGHVPIITRPQEVIHAIRRNFF
jgi:sigma-B regulation protein RsbQ